MIVEKKLRFKLYSCTFTYKLNKIEKIEAM